MSNVTPTARARARARQRALTRLALRYPDEYDGLLLDEMRVEGYTELVEVDGRRFWARRDPETLRLDVQL